MEPIKKVVLAYSGGLDTSIIVPWLRHNYGCEVVCFTADLGQEEELDGLEEKALKTGASKLIIRDLREEFLTDFVFPTLQAGAVYERVYLLGTSFARPLISKHLVEIAEDEGAQAIAHGCTGKGNDQVRFELTAMALNPKLQVIAPWREWNIRSREDALEYAAEYNVPVSSTLKSIYSRDRNLFHMSHEGGPLEDPWNEPHEEMFVISRSPEDAPDEPAYVTIGFEQGVPVSPWMARRWPPSRCSSGSTSWARSTASGGWTWWRTGWSGMKSRGVYETPGGTILRVAHQALESLCLDKQTMHYKDFVAVKYAELVYNGMWYTRLREALDAFVQVTQQTVTGTVRLKLYKGNVIIAGRKSPYSLYREDYASFGHMDIYDQTDAKGFINMIGLPLKVEAMLNVEGTGKSRYRQPDYTRFKRD
ncbi:MAG: argininosuccinate synthase [Anaerolineae bacterium]|nr:argininosuccinate synthase [Anaerolineae bacterium]